MHEIELGIFERIVLSLVVAIFVPATAFFIGWWVDAALNIYGIIIFKQASKLAGISPYIFGLGLIFTVIYFKDIFREYIILI